MLDREGRGIAQGHDHNDFAGHQVCHKVGQPIQMPLRPASLDGEIAALAVTMLGKATDERGAERARIGQGCGRGEQPDAIDLRSGLGDRAAWRRGTREPCQNAAEVKLSRL